MGSKKVTLVTGGIRSGKSRYALSLARRAIGEKFFIATAQPFDAAMTAKIKRHREERAGEFITIEEPLHLDQALKTVSKKNAVVLIDCLTLWVNNLLYHFKGDAHKLRREMDAFLEILASPPAPLIMVTNEIGLGVAPDNELARAFVDELGFINQRAARLSDDVIMLISGIPQSVKGGQVYEFMGDPCPKDPAAR